MIEEWRAIPGIDARYEASSLGRIRLAVGSRMTAFRPQEISQRRTTNGYLKINLYIDKKYSTHLVHRLIALAFLPRRDGMDVVNHKDANKQNNAVANLEWSTLSDNNRHAVVNGKRHASTNPKRAHKLRYSDAVSIRARRAAGEPTKTIAEAFGISSTAVRRIVANAAWVAPSDICTSGLKPHVVDDFGNLVAVSIERLAFVRMV